jgi:hypothetical protein
MAMSLSGALRGRNKTEKKQGSERVDYYYAPPPTFVCFVPESMMPSSLSLPQVLLRHTAHANLRRSKACLRTSDFLT